MFLLALETLLQHTTLLPVTLYRTLGIFLRFLFCYFYLEVGSCEGNHLEIPSCVQREALSAPCAAPDRLPAAVTQRREKRGERLIVCYTSARF